MKIMGRAASWVDRAAMATGMILVAAIACIMLAQVFFRYVLNSSLQWSEELSISTMIWVVFLGSAVLVRGWQHIAVTAFVKMLPLRMQGIAYIVAKTLSLVFLAVMTYYAFVIFFGPIHATSPSLGISARWAKLSLAVGGVLMMLAILGEIGRDVAAHRRGDRAYFDKLGEGGSL
jgi:TRAP-type C4-dicarboxylate transport system permease small subunit